jgi:hypothetical protein
MPLRPHYKEKSMKSRLLALCMLLVLIVALVPGVMAQDTANPMCGNLSADDCTALTTAFTNTGSAGSGAFTLASTIEVQSDDSTQAGKVDINADGKFSGVTPMSMTDMTSMSTDPAAAIKQATDSLKGFTGELNLNIGLPAEAGTSLGLTEGQPFTLNLLLVDGVGYIDFSKMPATIAPLLQAYKIPNGWAGLDLVDTLTNVGPSLASSASGSTDTTAATADLPKIQALASKYLTYTRDGNTFTGNLDLAGLFNDADFQALVKSADSDKEITDAQQAAIDSLKDAKFEVVFTLDGDKLGELKLTVNVPGSTLTALQAADADSSSSDTKAPTAVNVSLDLKYSGLGEAQTIAAPAGAPVAKFADLTTMFGSMMGGGSSG